MTEIENEAEKTAATENEETVETAEAAETAETADFPEAEDAGIEADPDPVSVSAPEGDTSFIPEYTDNPYNNIFVESLENITPDDLGKPPEKKKKSASEIIYEVIRQTVYWVAVAAFLYSGYQIVYKLYAYRQADDIYKEVAGIMDNTQRDDIVKSSRRSLRSPALVPVNGTREESGSASDMADSEEFNELFESMKGNLANLKRKNPEVVGWIRIEGDTEVNYPVVQHKDLSETDYYLTHAYNGTYNPAGSIYLQYNNNVNLSTNRHSIIYGHNMESGSPMFANLLHYGDAGYLENNRYIDVYTQDALYTFEVFAAYSCSASLLITKDHAWRTDFQQNDEVFLNWVKIIREQSDFPSKLAITASDRILTLSTCTNYNNDRYVVHAVLVKVTR